MDFSIASILTLDGLTNGAIYALLGMGIVLVFTVTRVIFIPQGEFVAYGALTLAIFQTGKVPGTVWLLLILAGVAALMELVDRPGATAAARAPALMAALRTFVAAGGHLRRRGLGRAAQPAAARCRRCSRCASSRPSGRWCTAWPTSRWRARARWCC